MLKQLLFGSNSIKRPLARQLSKSIPAYNPLPRSSPQPIRRRRIILEEPQQRQVYEPPSPFTSYGGSNNGNNISPSDPLAQILNEPTIVIQRQIEFMNLFLGFEQANRYVVMDSNGQQIGHLIERDFGILKVIMRQFYRLHRPFVVDLVDNSGNVLMTIRRPFSFINSHIKAILPNVRTDVNAMTGNDEGLIIGESAQSWHLWRRRYNLFKADDSNEFEQFAKIDAGLLSWEFPAVDKNGYTMGAVSRNFVGFMREFLTDTGVYIVRMDPRSFHGLEDYYQNVSDHPMTLDQKAVLLANAVSIDFDYFSRHSSGAGGGGWFTFGGGE